MLFKLLKTSSTFYTTILDTLGYDFMRKSF